MAPGTGKWGDDTGRPDAPAVRVRVLGIAGTVDIWWVPHALHGGSLDHVIRRLHHRRRRSQAELER